MNSDGEVLVPLTASLYLPGKISERNSVLVDVGTGYYVEKSLEQAQTFYSNKVKFVETNMGKLEQSISQKAEHGEIIRNMLSRRIDSSASSSA